MKGDRQLPIKDRRSVTTDMIRDTINSSVSDALEKTLPSTIQIIVNGKIDKIQKTLDENAERQTQDRLMLTNHIKWEEEYHNRINQFMDEMLPIKDGLHTVQKINTFLKWVGIPSLIALLLWFKETLK